MADKKDTLAGGFLIAWAGIVGNMVLSSVANQQESARLITELQVKREQAESELRKDVFDQALDAFLLKVPSNGNLLQDMSKQLLRLELLSLNFGDSLSLSPLFIELKKDLERARPANDKEGRDYEERRAELLLRLESLAKRVASSQLSALEQHGKSIDITIELIEDEEYRKLSDKGSVSCGVRVFEGDDYTWPDNEISRAIGSADSHGNELVNDVSQTENETLDNQHINTLILDGVEHELTLFINNVDHCKKTAKVTIDVHKPGQNNKPYVNKEFTLDYYNFPMVDNTRLPNNQRVAIVMNDFRTKVDTSKPESKIEMIAIVFPAEYASLRDRSGMEEARKLFESAMNDNHLGE